jgi:hypothetical protein
MPNISHQSVNNFDMFSPSFHAKWNITSKYWPRWNVNRTRASGLTEGLSHFLKDSATEENKPSSYSTTTIKSSTTTTTTASTTTRNRPEFNDTLENQDQFGNSTDLPVRRKIVVKHRTTTTEKNEPDSSVRNEVNVNRTATKEINMDVIPADLSHWEVVANVSKAIIFNTTRSIISRSHDCGTQLLPASQN